MKIVAVEPIGISQERAKQLSEIYAQKGHQFVVYPDRKEDAPTLIERMQGAEVVIVSNIPLKKEVLQECKDLKFLNVAFTGLDHIDQDYCKENNILIRNASGYATTAVAELAVGLMLDVYRKMTEFDLATRKLGTRNNILGRELRGKTVALIGTGAIGLATAKLLKAFGCKLIAYSRSERKEALELGIEYLSLEEAVKQADIISLHTPLTKETKNLISKEVIDLCKPSAIIINTARGGVIDNLALANALNEDRLAGAGIDVYEKEPPLEENHPLLSAKNTVLLPHVAYATRESFDIRIDIILNNLNQYINE
ncbi:MAG: NAD(P)-dependent oxidoreductase, partial [Bacteroidales bacterium]|nr:NAD(P)-dependent oxidoreductase [Bacteroidales bacterium]